MSIIAFDICIEPQNKKLGKFLRRIKNFLSSFFALIIWKFQCSLISTIFIMLYYHHNIINWEIKKSTIHFQNLSPHKSAQKINLASELQAKTLLRSLGVRSIPRTRSLWLGCWTMERGLKT